MSSMLYVFRWIPKDALLPQLVEHVQETCYGPHSITLGGVSNTNIVRNVSRVSNSSANNSHTHTDNTRQPESQLKSSSCSSVISSHNSRDAIPSHNSRNAMCLTPIPSHNSRDMFRATTQGTPASRPLRYHWSIVDHAHPQHTSNYFDHGPRIHDAPTNLPARGPTYTNLPTRSPTIRTSPPIVQHTWSNRYEPPRSQQPSSVNTEHTNFPARILTWEHHNMNLPAHIITCSPPTMNLLTHETNKNLLVQVSHHKHAKRIPKEHTVLCAIAWHYLSAVRWNHNVNRLAGTSHRQGQSDPDPLFLGLSPSWSLLNARRLTFQRYPILSYRLTASHVLPSAIPIVKLY